MSLHPVVSIVIGYLILTSQFVLSKSLFADCIIKKL